jgi:hypothetical protein
VDGYAGYDDFERFLAAVDRDSALAETRAEAQASVTRRLLLGLTLAGGRRGVARADGRSVGRRRLVGK